MVPRCYKKYENVLFKKENLKNPQISIFSCFQKIHFFNPWRFWKLFDLG